MNQSSLDVLSLDSFNKWKLSQKYKIACTLKTAVSEDILLI